MNLLALRYETFKALTEATGDDVKDVKMVSDDSGHYIRVTTTDDMGNPRSWDLRLTETESA